MAKVRDDLVGVVYLNDGRKLAAGDTIPSGVEVGDHLVAQAATSGRRQGKGDADNASG